MLPRPGAHAEQFCCSALSEKNPGLHGSQPEPTTRDPGKHKEHVVAPSASVLRPGAQSTHGELLPSTDENVLRAQRVHLLFPIYVWKRPGKHGRQ